MGRDGEEEKNKYILKWFCSCFERFYPSTVQWNRLKFNLFLFAFEVNITMKFVLFLPFHSTCLSGKSTSIGIVDAGHRIMHKIPASLIYQNQLNYCAITYIRWNIYWFWFGFFFYFRVRDVWFLKIKTVFRRIFVHLIVYLLEKWVLSLSDLISHVLVHISCMCIYVWTIR